jgi:hypothetical protein
MKTSIFRQLGPRALNLMLWLNVCALTGTGMLLAWRLPPGSRGGRGLSALGLDRHGWGDIHMWLGYAFGALILVHLAVHWRWLWQFASRRRAWPMLAGLGLGLLLVVALILLPVVKSDRGHDAPEGRQAP